MVAPTDWKEVLLGDICELSLAASKKSRSDGRGKYIIADMGSVSKDGSFLTHKTTDVREDVLRTGDLVMPKDDIGGGQIIGKAVLVDEDERYVLGDHVYRLRLSDGCPAFVRYGINSYKVNIQLRSKVVGSAQLGLGRRAVLEQPISFPLLKEQEAIAEALSDADAAIESLDALVAKKRDLKQATMQQLLTGRTRLPGFTADWKEAALCKVADIGPGINKALSEMGSGALYVTVEDIYSGSCLDIRRLGRIRVSKSEIERFSLQEGDLVLGKSSVKRDGIGYPNLFLGCTEPVVPSGFTYRVRPDTRVLNSKYLLQYLRSRPGRKWIIDNSQSSALTNINSTIVNRYPIVVPPLKEQEAIAEALTVMDDELEALTEQVSKLRMVKEGMMQDLLTGKVRLV